MMQGVAMKNKFDKAVASCLERAMDMHVYLTDHPELSGEEYESCAYIVNACRAAHMEVEEGFCDIPTAFRATVCRAQNPVGKVAILCEYDALPSIGHGCGHSANGTISFLGANALKIMDMMDSLPMDIDLIGTPDEELHGSKVDMANAGVFDAYDFAIMVHVSGDVSRVNTRFLALHDYRIKFYGQPAHAGSEPWLGVNALNGAQLALHAVDMLRQHVRPETRMASYMVSGGTASNVVPAFAELECCLRHTEKAYLEEVVEKVMNCIKGAALATGTKYEVVQWGNIFDDMNWNERGSQLLRSVMGNLGIAYETKRQWDMGSSDIGSVSYRCPSFHPELRMEGGPVPCHTKEFALKMKEPAIETTIIKGAKIIGHAIVSLMENPSILQEIRDEFKQTKKDDY